MKFKITILSIASLYIISYIGFRISGHITHTSKERTHFVMSRGSSWDSVVEVFDKSERQKRTIINNTYLPLRKVEETYWNIVY